MEIYTKLRFRKINGFAYCYICGGRRPYRVKTDRIKECIKCHSPIFKLGAASAR